MPRPIHLDLASIMASTSEAIAPFLVDTVTITDLTNSTPSWDNTAGQIVTTAGSIVYAGSASLMLMSDAGIQIGTNDAAETGAYLVRLPHGATGLRRGQRVTVTASTDPDLVGHSLTITKVEVGTVQFSRVVYATRND